MVIQPNSTIKIYSGVPLDQKYENTLYFTSIENQKSYFHGLGSNDVKKFTLDEYSYVRHTGTSIKVEKKAEQLYDCNYIAFQNTSFGEKWFYAFITGVEYVNNDCSIISFEIDTMQTYLFDAVLGECYVEREHTETDVAGDNLVPENVELGEYKINDIADPLQFYKALCLVVASTFEMDYDPFTQQWINATDSVGAEYGGIYSGLHYTRFGTGSDDIIKLNSFLDAATKAGKAGGIASIFMMPATGWSSEGTGLPSGSNLSCYLVDTAIKRSNGNVPKNKKLSTYPYRYLEVTNNQGSSTPLRYEYFQRGSGGLTVDFQLYCDMSCNPSMVCVPKNYNGLELNIDEKIVLSGFPTITWNIDSFNNWLANNGIVLAMNVLTTTMGGVASALAGNVGGLVSSAGNVMGIGAEVLQQERKPSASHGTTSGTASFVSRSMQLNFYNKVLRPEYVDIIDDYFTIRGYACKKVKVPNTHARPHWTYVKTRGCNITGKMPADEITKMKNIYDNGITFWKNASEVGNYSLDNSV